MPGAVDREGELAGPQGHLDGDEPHVSLPATATKRLKSRTVPLSALLPHSGSSCRRIPAPACRGHSCAVLPAASLRRTIPAPSISSRSIIFFSRRVADGSKEEPFGAGEAIRGHGAPDFHPPWTGRFSPPATVDVRADNNLAFLFEGPCLGLASRVESSSGRLSTPPDLDAELMQASLFDCRHGTLRPSPDVAVTVPICPKKSRKAGAGEGNRTPVVSLGSFCSTIELHPHPAFL